MKTFEELTIEQRLDAYRIAREKLEESLKDGFIEFKEIHTSDEIVELSEEIAESATYDENGKAYVEEMRVPYFFLGGCV